MKHRQKLKHHHGHFLLLNPQLLLQLPPRRPLRPHHRLLQPRSRLARDPQRVRTAGIRPHVRKGDFFGGALLEEEFFGGGVEEEDGEGAVEEAGGDVGH